MRKACAPPTTKSKKAHEPPMLAALQAVPWLLETYKTGLGSPCGGLPDDCKWPRKDLLGRFWQPGAAPQRLPGPL